jgi:hypothetical protein
MWKQGNKEGALKTFRLGKSKAQPGDKNLPVRFLLNVLGH